MGGGRKKRIEKAEGRKGLGTTLKEAESRKKPIISNLRARYCQGEGLSSTWARKVPAERRKKVPARSEEKCEAGKFEL